MFVRRVWGVPLRKLHLDSNQQECLKWFALVLMVADHVGVFWDVAWLRYPGRMVYPIFALLVAYNYVYNTKNKERYLKRMAVWAIIAEPFYQVSMASVEHHHPSLSIMFTLFYGLWLTHCIDQKKPFSIIFLSFFALIPLLLVSSYGLFGLLLIPTLYFALRRGFNYATTSIFSIVLSVLNAHKYIFATIAVVPIIVLFKGFSFDIKRFPGKFFYVFYPLHLIVLSLAANLPKAFLVKAF